MNMKMLDKYDIIVVGAGHAGCEAAAAAARMGSRTLLITMDMTKMAQMSCNPAMGGIAKGQIIREIDALGGLSGVITDKSTIQFRMLNRSKGPAMWSPRAQCDRMVFSTEWRKELERIENLEFFQDLVVKLLIRENKIFGVETRTGIKIHSKAVILTNGTFLNGLMHVGKSKQRGGRSGEQFAYGISEQLEKLGIEKGRMKTGTPARLDGRSIDFDKLLEQKGERRSTINCFSYSSLKKSKQLKERSCYITYTNESVHDLLKEGFDESPLFTGRIEGIGPRYCPSIEDKIVTFSDKDSHHLFLEPEGESTIEWYVNGFSSSLPWNIQLKALRRVKGLEKVKFFRPGYAIEYDYFLPTQLKRTLESNKLKNLWLAGQINGTTGYEEAAAQGLISGINAHLCINKKEEFVLRRNEAYIGVLIDDLVSKGVDEPYRMFTSRAEYRILLRQDNADTRLSKRGYKLGLINKSHFRKFTEKENKTSELVSFINNLSIKPERINVLLNEKGSSLVDQSLKAGKILLRPEITIKELVVHIKELKNHIDSIKPKIREEVLLKAEIEIKYRGYIEREKLMADKLTRLEEVRLKPDFDYNSLQSISTEARQKLSQIKPATIAQAKSISGVSPADISVILVKLGR